MTGAAYLTISAAMAALPFVVNTGSGLVALVAAAVVFLAAGYLVPSVRVLGAGLAIAACAVAAGHHHGAGSLLAGGASGVLALLLLTLPTDRDADAWVLRALAIELPAIAVAAVLAALGASLRPGHVSLIVGALAAGGLVALAIPAGAALRRRGRRTDSTR
jgi:hypothetical protein